MEGAVLYDGPGYPYVVEEVGGGGVVHGDLVTARPEEYPALLTALDLLEEYAPGDPRSLYERVARQVLRETDGTAVRAWVYVAAPTVATRLRTRGAPIPSGDWGRR